MSAKSDAIRTLRGGQRFLNDLNFPRLLETRVILSEIFRGRFTLTPPAALPPGVRLYTAADIPGANTIAPDSDGLPLLSPGEIRYRDQPLALLTGDDPAVLEALAETLILTYEEEVPTLTLEPERTDRALDSLSYTHGRGTRGAGREVSGEYSFHDQEFRSPQPQGAAAVWENKQLTVFCSTRNPFHVRANIAAVLGIEPQRVSVVVPDAVETPGDNETLPAIIASLAALAAFHSKRGARVALEHSVRVMPSRIRLTTRLTTRGVIAGTRANLILDTGAAALHSPDLFRRAVYALAGAYQHPSLAIEARALATNKAPYGRFLSGGVREAFCAVELHISRLARAAGLNPFAFRRANLFHASSHTPREQRALEAVLTIIDQAARASDFDRKYASCEAFRADSGTALDLRTPLRGIGSALACNGFDFIEERMTGERHAVTLTLEKDGTLRILTSALETGQALRNLFSSIAARTLEIDMDDVIIETLDTARVPDSGPMYETHALTVIGRLIEQACVLLKKKKGKTRKAVSVTRTEAPPVARAGRPRVVFHASDAPALSWCATVVEVEINPADYRVTVKGVWTAIESGVILNRDIAQAQVEREVRIALDLVARTPFAHRHKAWPRTSALPLSVSFTETPYARGPLGAKGIGELPGLGIAPAWLAAVSQALGRDVSHTPLSPLEIEELGEER